MAEHLNVTKLTLDDYVKRKDEILFECVRIGLAMQQTQDLCSKPVTPLPGIKPLPSFAIQP